MRLSAFLGLAAVLAMTAMPSIGSAQRHSRVRSNAVGGYGRGPFYPSWIPGASQRYVGAGAPLRFGGASVYFGPGGGYYGYAPTYYGYGYAPYGYSGYGYAPTYRYVPGRRLYHRHRR